MKIAYVPTVAEQLETAQLRLKWHTWQKEKAEKEVARLQRKVSANPDWSTLKDILNENIAWLALETSNIEDYKKIISAFTTQLR